MDKEPTLNQGPKVPTLEVDLSAAWDTVSEAELFIEALKANGLHAENLRFSGFKAEDIAKQREIIFCCNEEELFSGELGEEENALKYALKHENSVVAVYDGSKLKHVLHEGGYYAYRLKEPGALKAYVHLRK